MIAVAAMFISLLTSVCTGIAFLATFTLSWFKERRETALFKLEMERKKLENEKLELELRDLRGTGRSEGSEATPQD